MSKKVKVMVMKMYVVDGKKMGKSVSFNLDPEEMADCSSSAMVKKRVLDKVAGVRVFSPEDLHDLKFDMKEFMKAWRLEVKKRG